MSETAAATDKRPTPDPAEDNAFFPSPYSLAQYTSPKSDLADASYPKPYEGGRWKVLMIGTDERYLLMKNGTFFSTGNHPIETLLPMIHLHNAGFEIEIATLSGNPVKFEWWAFPHQDTAVSAFLDTYRTKLKQPMKLADVVAKLDRNSDYIGLFVPGGHGALIGLPDSLDIKAALEWAMANDRYVITLCHGPACLIATGLEPDGRPGAQSIFEGYKIAAFPDAADKTHPATGYTPGPMPWFFGERLAALGIEIVNGDITGRTHQDRKLITGDSPAAANATGKLAAKALLAEVGDKA